MSISVVESVPTVEPTIEFSSRELLDNVISVGVSLTPVTVTTNSPSLSVSEPSLTVYVIVVDPAKLSAGV